MFSSLRPPRRLLQGNYRLVAMDNGDAVFDLDPDTPSAATRRRPTSPNLGATSCVRPRPIIRLRSF